MYVWSSLKLCRRGGVHEQYPGVRGLFSSATAWGHPGVRGLFCGLRVSILGMLVAAARSAILGMLVAAARSAILGILVAAARSEVTSTSSD